MKELLRVAMDEKQIKEACIDWARSRSRIDGAAARVDILGNGASATIVLEAEVIFTKKRERKAKEPTP